MKKRKKRKKGDRKTIFAKLSLFQKPMVKFFRPCPLSGKNAPIVNVGNVVDMPRYDRFSDYFELMKDMNADAIKVIKKMSPEELKFSKSLQKNPYQAKKLKELILKLDDLLPGDYVCLITR